MWSLEKAAGDRFAACRPSTHCSIACMHHQASFASEPLPVHHCRVAAAGWAGRRGWQLRVAVLSSSKDSPWNKCSEEGRSWTRWGFHNGEKMSRTALWLREAIGPSSSLSSLHPSRSRGDLPVNDADVRDESTEVISVDLHRRNGGRNCKRSCQAGTEHRHTVSVS